MRRAYDAAAVSCSVEIHENAVDFHNRPVRTRQASLRLRTENTMNRFVAIGVDIAIIGLISISLFRNGPLFTRDASQAAAPASHSPALEALAR
jgi:hypothetical protein